jgi:hypothetical protein
MVSILPSGFLMFTTYLESSIVSMVPEIVTVCVGSVLVCA